MNVTFYQNPDASMAAPGLPELATGQVSTIVDKIRLVSDILQARGTAQ
jgi:hypothetical protein